MNPTTSNNSTNEEVERPNANNNGEELIQSLITALQGFVQHQTPATANPQHVPNAPASPTINQVIEQFRRCNPPTFYGQSGPLALDEWMRGSKEFLNTWSALMHKRWLAQYINSPKMRAIGGRLTSAV